MDLGNWAFIDIETTGIDHSFDQIIDLGFVQFEGDTLVKQYSSLVKSDQKLSQFIQKLTGIKQSMINKAPLWREVEPVLGELEDHILLAHNAGFEKNFLGKYFEDESSEFHDSLFFLGLIFSPRTSLNLESFIQDFNLREHEVHRGLEDSIDLLKVCLCASYLSFKDKTHKSRKDYISTLSIKYKLTELWYFKLYFQDQECLEKIADQIDFPLVEHVEMYLEKNRAKSQKEDYPSSPNLDFSGENIKEILRDTKRIKEIFPHYKFREGQETLALRAGQSFKNNIHAMVQAPTGTGKTLGYMIPSALFSLDQKKQVLIATGTKTLQEQALKKDLPQLRKLLGLDESKLKTTRLLGSSNHLCELLFRRDIDEQGFLIDGQSFDERFAQAYFEYIFYLNDMEKMSITRDDLAYILKKLNLYIDKAEKDYKVDFRACTGKRCPFKSGCSYLNGIMEAKDSHLILGNHALMFSWPKGFPRPGHIIVDEAHKIESEATNAFTIEITESSFSSFVKSLDQMQGVGALFFLISSNEEDNEVATAKITELRDFVRESNQILKEHLESLGDTFESFFKQRPRYTSLYWNEIPMPSKKGLNQESLVAIYNALESIGYIIKTLCDKFEPYSSLYEPGNLKEENELSAYSKFESFFGTLEEFAKGFNHLLSENNDYASAIKFHETYGFALESSPVDIGRIVHDQLLAPSESVVFTSATLANAKGDMGTKAVEWGAGYIYLDPERRYRSGFYIDPLYDYKNKAKVFLCEDTPSLYEKNFIPNVLEDVIELIKNLEGRSLLLFSAKVRFELAREVLLEKLDEMIPLFIQGMGNNIIEDYKNSSRGVLLGMESFGEGIDIPGESLQFVFIDKIPDLRQDFSITQRREFYQNNFGNEFVDYFLSMRARGLQQKLGRLIRSEQDRGGAIIVDSRVKRWKGRTIDQFMQLMDPYEIKKAPLKEACDEVFQFIKSSD